jgi:hypothetical protein
MVAPRKERWRDTIRAFLCETVIPLEQQAFAGALDSKLRVQLSDERREVVGKAG